MSYNQLEIQNLVKKTLNDTEAKGPAESKVEKSRYNNQNHNHFQA